MADDIRLKVDLLKARLAVADAIEKAKGGKGKKPGDQPRHPAGSPLGGRWKKGGGASGGEKKPSKGSTSPDSGGTGAKSPSSGMGVPKWLQGLLPGFSSPTAMAAQDDWFGGMGGMKQPKPEPPYTKPSSSKAVKHTEPDDNGRPVYIQHPTTPSAHSTWTNPAAAATFVPGGDAPAVLNGVPMQKWDGVDDWTKVPGQRPELEAGMPDLSSSSWKHPAAGVIIEEPDGRLWITTPTNRYGGYRNTYPKGTQEKGLTLQQTAIKEAWEETGLQIEITGVVGDFERTTSISRFYLAKRVGGTPSDQGWESQAIRLVPPTKVKSFLNMPIDRDIIDLLWAERDITKFREVFDPATLERLSLRIDALVEKAGGKGKKPSKGGAWETQPRWPGGSPLGGQWKSYDSAGLVKPPSIGTKANKGQQNKADAAYNLAKAGDWGKVGEALFQTEKKVLKFGLSYGSGSDGQPTYGKAPNSQQKWNQSLHQYLHALVASKGQAMAKTTAGDKASGPAKLSSYKKTGSKPGGSNPGGIYTDADGTKWLVKGANHPSDDRAKNEVLASKLMQAAGIGAPDMKLVDLEGQYGGGLGVAAKMTDLGNWSMANKAHMEAAQKEFAVHAWLANYDAVGMPVGDNLAMVNGSVFNFDPGGALLYRAQGLPKNLPGGMLSKTVDEWQGMRTKAINAYATAVYGSMTDKQLKASAALVASIDDKTIIDLVNTYGPGDGDKKGALADALIQRKADIMAKANLSPADLTKTPPPSVGATTIEPGDKPDVVQPDPVKAEPPKVTPAFAENSGQNAVVLAGGAGVHTAVGLSNTKGSHNKFYAMTVHEDGTLVKQWGKIGTKGMAKVEQFDTVNDAKKAAMAQMQKKVEGGYEPNSGFVHAMGGAQKGATAPQASGEPKAPPQPEGPPITGPSHPQFVGNALAKQAVENLPNSDGVKDILQGAMANIEGAVQGDWGDHSQKLLNKAQDELNAVAGMVQPGSVSAKAHAVLQSHLYSVAGMTNKEQQVAPAKAYGQQPKPDAPDVPTPPTPAAFAQLGASPQQANIMTSVGEDLQTAMKEGNPDKWDAALTTVAALNASASETMNAGGKVLSEYAANIANNSDAAAMVEDKLGVVKPGPTPDATNVVADGKPPMPQAPVFQPTSPNAVNYYNGLVSKMDEAYQSGDLGDLIAAGEGKTAGKKAWPTDSVTGEPKGANAQAAADYHSKLVDNLKGVMVAQAQENLKPTEPVASGGRKNSGPAMPDFEASKLPSSNTNSKSHNKKVDVIKGLADAGDVKGILALNYGTNTYGKQQASLANDALAALGSSYTVDPGQKKNSHDALKTAGSGSDTLSGQQKATAKLTKNDLPPHVDFTGKSSKTYINEANQKDYDALTALALDGDIQGVKNYKFAELSKETGQPTGKMLPVSQHPSQHITGHQDYLLQQMDEKLNPPKPLEIFQAKMAADSVAKLAAKFKPAKLGMTSKKVPSTQKVGHFIALGQVANPEKLTPKGQKNFNSAQIAQAFDDYKVWGKDSNAKTFASLIQGHGGHEYHKGFDLGTATGKTRLAQAKAAHKYARKQPAGTKVYKWENLSADAKKKLESAQPGLIIQNPAPTCCSYSPTATKGFGSSHRWNIVYSDGAKGFNSFGTGKFSGEKEVTMLPNHRFMILSHKKAGGSQSYAETTVLLLPPDPTLDEDYWD